MAVIRTQFVDLKLIAYTNGLLLIVLAISLSLIGGLTHWSQDKYDLAFFGAAFATAFFGELAFETFCSYIYLHLHFFRWC